MSRDVGKSHPQAQPRRGDRDMPEGSGSVAPAGLVLVYFLTHS